ncbi:MAG: hypothetical protein LQ343_001134 [Gyalolechia ehrenbergii]|nr:MAG: hypothetical protein LQ343_001134 [Gyalolechia ehrenbergii]
MAPHNPTFTPLTSNMTLPTTINDLLNSSAILSNITMSESYADTKKLFMPLLITIITLEIIILLFAIGSSNYKDPEERALAAAAINKIADFRDAEDDDNDDAADCDCDFCKEASGTGDEDDDKKYEQAVRDLKESKAKAKDLRCKCTVCSRRFARLDADGKWEEETLVYNSDEELGSEDGEEFGSEEGEEFGSEEGEEFGSEDGEEVSDPESEHGSSVTRAD